MAIDISAVTNPRVKSWATLRDRKHRNSTGLFLVEGHREIQRMAQLDVVIDTLIVAPTLVRTQIDPPAPGRTVSVGDAVFAKLSYRQNPDGWLAVVEQPSLDLHRLSVSDRPFIVVIEGLEKPGNLGAILRTADGAGVDAVILANSVVDVFNPNVVRAAQGSLFAQPIAVAATGETAAWLGDNSIDLLIATPEAKTTLWEAPIGDRVAVLVGSEHAGVSTTLRDGAGAVAIPMAGTADSLNAATAAALLMFEVVRRRR
jgi:RNA methyltransferase, TrmH family